MNVFLKNLLGTRYGKRNFILKLPARSKVLDVGCGNNSPLALKEMRNDIYYVGVDVGEYNTNAQAKAVADKYVLTPADLFADTIAKQGTGVFDGVISSHNIEHCEDPGSVLMAMCNALRPNGMLYLSFPSEASVHFPSRNGTLNFYDDKTHKTVPVWKDILAALNANDMEIVFSARQYRPFVRFCYGLLFYPLSVMRKVVDPHGGIWALYGFESMIWAKKRLPVS